MARKSQAKRYNADSFSINLDNALQNKLDTIFGNIGDTVMRPGAFAASTVIYDEMKIRVPKDEGTLEKAIYRYREKEGDPNVSLFYIGPNKRIAQHWSLVENGHFQVYQVYFDEKLGEYRTNVKQVLAVPKFVAAKPYVRPTYDAKIDAALQAGLREMHIRLQALMNGNKQLN